MNTGNSLPILKMTKFSEFYPAALKWRSPFFLSYFSFVEKTEGKKTLRLAVIASKKGVSKKAVQRNRARRRLRQALLAELMSADLPEGIEARLVVMASQKTLSASWQELKSAAASIVLRINVQCRAPIQKRE